MEMDAVISVSNKQDGLVQEELQHQKVLVLSSIRAEQS